MTLVIAAAQSGVHEDGRATYGHSLVVDPWGTVLLDMADAAGLGFVEIDPAMVAAVRARIPVIAHRRPIAPVAKDWTPKQVYFPDTNVLITRFLTEEGVGEIQGFMPIADSKEDIHRHRLISRVEGVRG